MDVNTLIIEDIPYDGLQVGDSILSWTSASDRVPVYISDYAPDRHVITRFTDDYVYYTGTHTTIEQRFTDRNCGLLFRVQRTCAPKPAARVPCVKCGRPLHPDLSGLRGYTHGC